MLPVYAIECIHSQVIQAVIQTSRAKRELTFLLKIPFILSDFPTEFKRFQWEEIISGGDVTSSTKKTLCCFILSLFSEAVEIGGNEHNMLG